MKSWQQQIISFPLVIAILLSTTGIVVFEHHCLAAEQTGATSCAKDCCKKTEHGPNCCSNEFTYFSIDHDQLTHHIKIEVPNDNFQFITRYFEIWKQLVSTEMLKPDYLNFKPPLLRLNIPLLVQSFLL